MKGRILFWLAILLGGIQSCQHYDPLTMKLPDEKINPKLNASFAKINNEKEANIGTKRIFNHEVKENLCHFSTFDTTHLNLNQMGSVELTVIKQHSKYSVPLSLFCFVTTVGTAGTNALLGAPVGHRMGFSKIKVDIRNEKGELLRTYKASAHHVSFIALYWGNKVYPASMKATDRSLMKALRKIRKEIDEEIDTLNKLLLPGVFSEKEILVKKNLSLAEQLFQEKKYAACIEKYKLTDGLSDTLFSNNDLANYQMGLSNLALGNKEEATKFLVKTMELNPKFSVDIPETLATLAFEKHDYVVALNYLNSALHQFINSTEKQEKLQLFKERIETIKNQLDAGKLLLEKPNEYEISNLGSQVNSIYDDYFATFSMNNDDLIYSSNRVAPNIKSTEKANHLWVAESKGSAFFSAAKLFSDTSGITQFSDKTSLTEDGKTMVRTRCTKEGCKVYLSFLSGEYWQTPEKLVGLNSAFSDDDATISPDGKVIVWSSNRTNGYGEYDLWWTKKTPTGWSNPQNLGVTINTSGNERSPSFHNDGHTLFFSSDFRSPRIGGSDIYRTTLLDNGQWTLPENMGYPINSEQDELSFVLAPNGKNAIFASNRLGGFGNYDLYKVQFPKSISSPISVLNVSAIDSSSRQSIPFKLVVSDVFSRRTIISRNSNEKKPVKLTTKNENGLHLLLLSKGYYFSEIELTSSISEVLTFDKSLALEKVYLGWIKQLQNVQWEQNEFSSKFKQELINIAQFLQINPEIQIELIAYPESELKETLATKITLERATQIAQFLMSNGIDGTRILVKGNAKPKNISKEKQSLIIEFKVLKF